MTQPAAQVSAQESASRRPECIFWIVSNERTTLQIRRESRPWPWRALTSLSGRASTGWRHYDPSASHRGAQALPAFETTGKLGKVGAWCDLAATFLEPDCLVERQTRLRRASRLEAECF